MSASKIPFSSAPLRAVSHVAAPHKSLNTPGSPSAFPNPNPRCDKICPDARVGPARMCLPQTAFVPCHTRDSNSAALRRTWIGADGRTGVDRQMVGINRAAYPDYGTSFKYRIGLFA